MARINRSPLTPVPYRVQLQRTKGWRMPENTLTVTRSTRWGNPFPIGKGDVRTGEEAARAYALYLEKYPQIVEAIRETLKGRNLACWCPINEEGDKRLTCHASVILLVANGMSISDIIMEYFGEHRE